MEPVPVTLHRHQEFVKHVLDRSWKHTGLLITIQLFHLKEGIDRLVTVEFNLPLDSESRTGFEKGYYKVTYGFERHYDNSEEHWQSLWGVFCAANHTIKTGGLVAQCRYSRHDPPMIILESSQKKFNLVGYSDPSSQGIFTTEWPAKLQWQYFVIDFARSVRSCWANKGNERVATDEKSQPGEDTVKWMVGSLEELFGALPEPIATEVAGNMEDVLALLILAMWNL
ncbi:hypothetical protein B0H13DRAFT_1933948 [Mycena leptocephala]|nr:hypothetical protein B0H13DRAFT_1933948 [Mycena leptocephala]